MHYILVTRLLQEVNIFDNKTEERYDPFLWFVSSCLIGITDCLLQMCSISWEVSNGVNKILFCVCVCVCAICLVRQFFFEQFMRWMLLKTSHEGSIEGEFLLVNVHINNVHHCYSICQYCVIDIAMVFVNISIVFINIAIVFLDIVIVFINIAIVFVNISVIYCMHSIHSMISQNRNKQLVEIACRLIATLWQIGRYLNHCFTQHKQNFGKSIPAITSLTSLS